MWKDCCISRVPVRDSASDLVSLNSASLHASSYSSCSRWTDCPKADSVQSQQVKQILCNSCFPASPTWKSVLGNHKTRVESGLCFTPNHPDGVKLQDNVSCTLPLPCISQQLMTRSLHNTTVEQKNTSNSTFRGIIIQNLFDCVNIMRLCKHGTTGNCLPKSSKNSKSTAMHWKRDGYYCRCSVGTGTWPRI